MSDEQARPRGPVDPAAIAPKGVATRSFRPTLTILSIAVFALGLIIAGVWVQLTLNRNAAEAASLATPTPFPSGGVSSTSSSSDRSWWVAAGDTGSLANPSPSPTLTPSPRPTPTPVPTANPIVGVLNDPDSMIASAEHNAGTGMNVPVVSDSPAADTSSTSTSPQMPPQNTGFVTPPPSMVASVNGGGAPDASTAHAIASTASQQPQGLTPPTAPLILRRDTKIEATMGVAFNSDHPAQPCVTTTRDYYDSLSFSALLIPAGTPICGEFHQAVVSGVASVVLTWSVIQYANGWDYYFSGNTVDRNGAAGAPMKVDNHTGRIFGNVALMTLVGTVAGLGLGGAGVVASEGRILPAAVFGNTILQSTSALANATIGKAINMPPTLHGDFGKTIYIDVVTDLPFPSAYPFSEDEP